LCKDGSVKWVLHHIKLIEGLPGPYKMILNARDVTEQRLAEEALRVQVDSLRESELFLCQGEKIARMGGWKANPITNQLLWTEGVNHLIEVATDYRPGLEEGLKFYKADYLPILNKLLIEAFHDGTSFNLETELVTATGKQRWTEVRGLGKIEDGSGVWVVGTIQDITDRKREEEEKKKLQLELAQAQKMESIGRLAGGIAHDFNNMLQAILTNTGLVLEELPPDSPLRGNLDEVMQCSRHSADLTRQLLAFARKQTIAPKVLDLNDTVKGMIKMLRRLIGEGIQLGWFPGPDLWKVNMDPGQIDQILANLCVNARDAINNVGKVIIETKNVTVDDTYVAGHPDALPGEYVLLTVSDNGCGMDRDALNHLFEPFFTTKGIGKGTGLGLATVYGIVDQNHGFINVYSEPNRGTTFKVYLPRYVGKSEKNQIKPPKQAINRGHETVLLVEDSLSILQSGKQLLESLGYNVLAANTPNEAIRLAKEHAGNIQLLITDVIMPEMNGRELSLKIFEYFPKIKCLYMSGYTANVIAHHGILNEGLNFIQKPFTNDVMAQKIRDLLDNKVTTDC